MAVAPRNDAQPRYVERGELSAPDLQELAEHTARTLLGVSAEEAFAMLDRGELEGKAAEWPLIGLRALIYQ